ncbi:phage tail sheath family protein [Alkaliphilus peptidifermentans]|uniref:Phage tail sheath protein n=1 Tax=Alkaliphilus peptidifermentans DSM 18978 TaxID=1120976 RepID=A0A1G5JZI0_9FIRM|nr:phage tail sheath family protein [Alkaliphilus peptidifermentans]SCY93270.1 Phage tail sheath protein [Alkaliphilus peptidifermentans DSM 18978]
MTGGTWTTQNKVRPGVYVNFESEGRAMGTIGDRGIVTIPMALSWGPANEVITIEAGENTSIKLGYPMTSPKLILIREALKRAKTLLLYRLNAGTAASATVGDLSITAKYSGLRGNDITITVSQDIDDNSKYNVTTFLSGEAVDSQTVTDINNIASNDWVIFSGNGELVETAGTPLTGGSDGVTTNENYLDYLTAIESYSFNTMAVATTDSSLKGVFASFCKRLREDEGRRIQVVLENYPIADYEGIISVKNGVVLADGSILTPVECTAWVAAATAGANVNQSLTYTAYDDAVDASPRYSNGQIIAALQAGEFVFVSSNGRAVVEQDINTLTSFTTKKGREFKKNRVIRVLDSINNDFERIFSDFYIGKISNNEDGRNLLKGECINYLELLENIEAIQNFNSQTDISVEEGNEAEAVYIETHIQPVDSIEKLYFKIRVR